MHGLCERKLNYVEPHLRTSTTAGCRAVSASSRDGARQLKALVYQAIVD